ncbi:MAG: N-acetyltransferase family protein [Candidatus Nanopelagicales bacterium]
MQIRDAAPEDAAGIAAIYNEAVLNTTAIWNDSLVDAASRAAWIHQRQSAGHPVLVAVDGEQVVGYATFGDWRQWDGYRFTIEDSVYVLADAQRTGIGQNLMLELIRRGRAQGKHVRVACIESGNASSIALHLKLGFEPAGVVKQVGTKFGRWLDLSILQLMLDGDRR